MFKATHIEIGYNSANEMWEVVQCFIPGAGLYTAAFPTLDDAKMFCATTIPQLEVVVVEGYSDPAYHKGMSDLLQTQMLLIAEACEEDAAGAK